MGLRLEEKFALVTGSPQGIGDCVVRALAASADNIRVNTVAPGVILTPFHDSMSQSHRERAKGFTSLGRLGAVEDCIGPYPLLAPDAMSGYVTGHIIDVNGGWYMSR